MTDVPVVDNKTLGASESPAVVNSVIPDAPQGHASGDAIGDKPTVDQQAPQEPNSSTVPSAAAASEAAPTAAINGQPAASEPSIAGPSSTDARPSDKPATAVSEPPQAASIPAPAEPVQNDISEGAGLAPTPAQQPLAAGANGETGEKDKDAGAPTTSGASPDIKVADAPPATEGVESEPSVGDKRKADELTQPPAPASAVAVEPASNGASATADAEKPESVEPAAKKPKLDETPDSAVKTDADTSEAVANGGGPKRGASRGKKDKKPVAPAPVGRTARKTRSQGPIES